MQGYAVDRPEIDYVYKVSGTLTMAMVQAGRLNRRQIYLTKTINRDMNIIQKIWRNNRASHCIAFVIILLIIGCKRKQGSESGSVGPEGGYPMLSKLVTLKKYKEANHMIDSLTLIYKNDGRLYFEKGVIAGDLENFADAVKFIRKADSLNCHPEECKSMLELYEPLMKIQLKYERKRQQVERNSPVKKDSAL